MAQNEADQQRRTDEVEGLGQGRDGSGDVESEGRTDPGTDQPEQYDPDEDQGSEADQLDQARLSGGGGRGEMGEYGDSGYEQPAWRPAGDAATDLQDLAADRNVGPLDG